jgi:hypothetical protein
LFFAVLGFVTVPLGTKSGWEHARVALSSPECARVVTEIASAAITTETRILQLIKSWVIRQAPTSHAPPATSEARFLAPHDAPREGSHASRATPIARPPRLSP